LSIKNIKLDNIINANPTPSTNGENGGIIANNETGYSRSEDNDKNVSRGTDGESWTSRTQTFDTGAESKVESERGKAKKPFQGGTAQTAEGSRRRYVLKLNEGTKEEISIDYTTKGEDDSEAYRAVKILKNKGYDVDYCDGSINITDKKGIVSQHNNAITIQNGKTLVSSNCAGSAEQTADHEEIHILQRTNNQSFVEYESVFCDNIILDNEAYLAVAKEINKEHHFVDESLFKTTEKLEEQLLELGVIKKTLNELLAYLRQCYNYDADLAKQKYGEMFENWDEVTLALDTLNNVVGRNTVSDPDLQSSANDGESIFTDPDVKDIAREQTPQEKIEALTGNSKTIRYRHVEDIAKKLDSGIKIVWDDGTVLGDKKGKWNSVTKTLTLNKNATLPSLYIEVFKHEFTHRLESKGTYASFKNYLIKKSSVFEQYVRSRLKLINGETFEGSREEAIEALTKHYRDRFLNDSI